MAVSLSTTSYAVLGMLSLRPWTPYELTQQMRRSLAWCWPTSERALYSEPERLVQAGYATAEASQDGLRIRRVYTITDAGRQALRAWLATEPAPPRFVNEPVLRLLFADQAGVDELVNTLETLRKQLDEHHTQGREQMRGYLDGDDAPFPNRAHLASLFADLYDRLYLAFEAWTDDTLAEVARWPTTRDLGLTPKSKKRLRRMLGRTG
jgi:DNA-binding PadR family transcriptional regulator